MRTNKKIFLLVLVSFFLLPCAIGAQVNAPDVIWVKENRSMSRAATDAGSSESIGVDQAVARSFQGNLTEIILGGHQMLQFSSVSNSASFSRHIMCKDHDKYYNPIDPTTIFRPSDTKAECLTTVSMKKGDTIEFRWYYRSNSSKTWVSCYNWSDQTRYDGPHVFAGYLNIMGYWPGSHYPRAYKVDVYLDGSLSFSEFFEVTNGGLNSPRICEDVDVDGHPVNMKSRFTIGVDAKAHHYLRFDKIAYFNEELEYCHDFTTVWTQPNGSTYKTYSGSFADYKDTNVTWNYWKYRYTRYDYISINSSTPVGNWKVEVYLDSHYFNNTWIRYGPIATTPFIVGSEPVADWTFMVYLDADSNLEPAGIEIFLKTASVGSSSRVNIVAQMDRVPGQDSRYGNWTDCKRFNVTEGMTPMRDNAALDLGEVNMGHPDTLKDFVNWTIYYYPANYYFLVLWGHGTGWMGVCFDITNATDALSLPELSQALSGLPAIMDVVLLDACSMSMTEVAYQIKDYANVLVGPEGLGYAPAPYDHYLSSLTNNPSMLPSAFARAVVTYYIDWCELQPIEDIPNATMSATDLTKITSLIAAIDDFALKLKENESFYDYLINSARNQTAGYQGPYANQSGYCIDLYHFAQLTNQFVLDEELQNTADQLMIALESIVIIEDDKFRPDSHGLSIFFPDEEDKYNYFESPYEETTFAEDTSWNEFVKYYLHIQTHGYALTIQTPYSYISAKIDDESYITDDYGKIRVFILPGSYTVNVQTTVLTEPSGSRGVFEQWSDSDALNPRTLDINGKLTLEAEYKIQYYLTVSTDPSGLTPQPSVYPQGPWYNDDAQVTCTAQEISGYVFDHWTVDGASQGLGVNPIGVTMDSPYEATVHYIERAPSSISPLTPSFNEIEKGGTITVSGSITPAHDGVPVTLTYKKPVGSTLNRTVISLSGGTFNDTYTPDAAGTWNVTASWLGDADHYGATSPVGSFRVITRAWWETLFRLEMLPVILGLVGIVLTVAFVGTAWVRTSRRRGVMKARGEPAAIEVSKILPGRITTGYGALDNILFGGIPRNYAVILASPSCDERDSLIKKFLETGAKKGEVTFYLTIDPGEVRSLVEDFQSNFYLFICNPQADKIIKSLPNVFKLKGVENLTEIGIALTKAFRRLDISMNGAKRACIEIISDVLLQHHAVQTRRFLTELITELKSRGFTTLAVVNPQMHPPEEVHAIQDLFEGEINIYEKETEKGLEKFLKIKKMYNQRYLESEMPLKKRKTGNTKEAEV